MKRFRFSLQTVHDVRSTARDEAERRLASANADVAKANDSVMETRNIRDREADALVVKYRTGDLDPRETALRFGYLEALSRQEAEARDRLIALERTRDRVREATTLAARDAEVTAKLRDRHLARHRAETARVEQVSLDELVVIAAARRRAEERI